MSEQPRIGDRVTAHFLDSEYGSMPSTAEGELGALVDECSGGIAFLTVGGRAIRPADLVSVHAGGCDHGVVLSGRHGDAFMRKYGRRSPADRRP